MRVIGNCNVMEVRPLALRVLVGLTNQIGNGMHTIPNHKRLIAAQGRGKPAVYHCGAKHAPDELLLDHNRGADLLCDFKPALELLVCVDMQNGMARARARVGLRDNRRDKLARDFSCLPKRTRTPASGNRNAELRKLYFHHCLVIKPWRPMYRARRQRYALIPDLLTRWKACVEEISRKIEEAEFKYVDIARLGLLPQHERQKLGAFVRLFDFFCPPELQKEMHEGRA